MARWVDLAAHDAALQVRQAADGGRELVVVRLREGASLPDEALRAIGFEAEGVNYVRRDVRFTLPELRRAAADHYARFRVWTWTGRPRSPITDCP